MKRRRVAAIVAAAVVLVPVCVSAWGGHRHHSSRVFIGGVWGPPYPYYYPYPVYAYPPPPPPPPPPLEPSEVPPSQSADDEPSSYGLVQFRGVPDGADVELDGRFWLTARALDVRWLALPEGAHRVLVRVEGETPIERNVQVAAGRNHVIRFAPAARAPG